MVLTYGMVYDQIRYELGGSPRGPVDMRRIVDYAGEYLVAAHEWKWTNGRPAHLETRAKLDAQTSVTWTASTKRVTKTGAFASYTFVDGDEMRITGGTDATTGRYKIIQKANDNSVVLATQPGSTDQTDYEYAEIELNTVKLPDDFDSLISIHGTDSITNRIRLVDYDQLLRLRTTQVDVTSSAYYSAALTYVGDNKRVPVLEIYPTPATTTEEQFVMMYRSGWLRGGDDGARVTSVASTTGETDKTKLPIPEWMEPLFLEMCREAAQGWTRPENGTMSQRLTRVMSGDHFQAMKRKDRRAQPYYGPLSGTIGEKYGRLPNFNTLATPAANPS